MEMVRAGREEGFEELEVESRSNRSVVHFTEEVYFRLQQLFNCWLGMLAYYIDQRVSVFFDTLEEDEAILGMEVA